MKRTIVILASALATSGMLGMSGAFAQASTPAASAPQASASGTGKI